MTLGTDLTAGVASLTVDSALLRAIVQGPASGPSSIVALPGGAQIKTLARVAAELAGSSNVLQDAYGDAAVTRYLTAAGLRIGPAPTQWHPTTTAQGITIVETAGLADGKNWDSFVSGNALFNRVVADAYATANTYHVVERSGITIVRQSWYTGASVEKLRLTSSGLGIGTLAPQYPLHLAGSDYSIPLVIAGASKGLRFVPQPNFFVIEGVDNSGGASYQPLFLNGSHVMLGASGAAIARVFGGGLRPEADAAVNNGDPSFRWGTIYAATDMINTSGREAKVGIRAMSDAERRAAQRILAIGTKLYRFKDAYDVKGDAARLHAGYIAEDVRDALEAEGLDPWAYGFMCADELMTTESYTETVVRPKMHKVAVSEQTVEIVDGQPTLVEKLFEREEPVGRMVPVVDEAGHVVMRPVADQQGERMEPIRHFVPEVEAVEEVRTREVPTGETRLGLRYSELEAFLKAAGDVSLT